MPSSVLKWGFPYHQLFLNNPLFPIEPKLFGSTCFVWDVSPQVSKIDPKSLKCIFLDCSRVQKGYRCSCSTLQRYFVSTDVTVFETNLFSKLPCFPFLPLLLVREDDDLLVYLVSSMVPTSTPAPIKPLITQVYSRCQNPLVSNPIPAALLLDPINN